MKERRCEKAEPLCDGEPSSGLRPDLVIIAQSGGHTETDWPAVTARVLALGARRVIVVGPFPLWRPSLPQSLRRESHAGSRRIRRHWPRHRAASSNDRTVAARVGGLANVTYVSLLDQLCPPSRFQRFGETSRAACLARVPGEGALDLMALDFGHFCSEGVGVPRSRDLEAVFRSHASSCSRTTREGGRRRRYLLPRAFLVVSSERSECLTCHSIRRRKRRAASRRPSRRPKTSAPRSATAIATSSRCIPRFGSTTSAISRSAGS